jgi:hypothetical protein
MGGELCGVPEDINARGLQRGSCRHLEAPERQALPLAENPGILR